MRGARRIWRYTTLALGGLAAPALLALAGAAPGDEPRPDVLPPAADPAAAVVPAAPLTLHACRGIALARQPAVAAARASLAAAAARSQALENLRAPELIRPELPYRRQQAALGVKIAEAGLAQAEADAVHAVTYTYLAALYARQQQAVADKVIDDFKKLQDEFREIAKTGGRRDITSRHVDLLGIYARVAQARREEAAGGWERALSGLREAMGVGPDCPLVLAGDRLPEVNPTVDRAAAVAAALARRGEVVQAALAAQVTCLEVGAQDSTHHRQVNTFAAGSDIHANPLPAGHRGETYQPGAVGLEMPTLLAGSREDRVAQARSYHVRALAVAEKARGLIALEADQAFLRWQEASRRVGPARDAAERSEKLYAGLRELFDPRQPGVAPDDLMNARVLASQVRVEANQDYYRLLQALAGLERATAGGFCAGFEAAGAPAPETNGKAPEGTDAQGKEGPNGM
jgi:outer membrane protein TolC